MYKIHNLSYSSEYSAWKHAKYRCSNRKDSQFGNYGKRGIRMHPEWAISFNAFIKYVGRKPSPKHWLERINNDKGYEPGNVKWELPHKNLLNRRKHKAIENFSDMELLRECKKRKLL